MAGFAWARHQGGGAVAGAGRHLAILAPWLVCAASFAPLGTLAVPLNGAAVAEGVVRLVTLHAASTSAAVDHSREDIRAAGGPDLADGRTMGTGRHLALDRGEVVGTDEGLMCRLGGVDPSPLVIPAHPRFVTRGNVLEVDQDDLANDPGYSASNLKPRPQPQTSTSTSDLLHGYHRSADLQERGMLA